MLRTAAKATRLASRAPRRRVLPRNQPYRALCKAANTSSSWFSEPDQTDGLAESKFHTEWPISKFNTILNICPEGDCMIVERLGSFSRVEKPGWFLTIPFIDQISYQVDMRERTMFYPPQSAITKDNVNVKIGAVIFTQFVDPVQAAYGAKNPLLAIKELAKSAMRATVGELELDEVFHSRKIVNERCFAAVGEAAANWGMKVTRHEILDVTPDRYISESLDKQAAAERMRREKVLQAEGEKQAAALESEGVKVRLTNESEGHLIRVGNEALAEQTRIEREAEGHARSIIRRAEAHAESLEIVTNALSKQGASDAARLELAREYIKMYGHMVESSNTIMLNDKPADVTALVTQAALALGATKCISQENADAFSGSQSH